MGMSLTQEQDKTVEKINDAMGDAYNCKYFLDGPHGGPNGKDYGQPGAMVMNLAIYRLNGNNGCVKIGYARIKPDGCFSLPKGLRRELNL